MAQTITPPQLLQTLISHWNVTTNYVTFDNTCIYVFRPLQGNRQGAKLAQYPKRNTTQWRIQGRPPLIFRPNLRTEGPKKIFRETAPPPLLLPFLISRSGSGTATCGLSLLLVLAGIASNLQLIRNGRVDEEQLCGCDTSKSLVFIILVITHTAFLRKGNA